MEVAGLVLGALPVAIEAIQAYRTILSSIKNTQRDLRSMTRDLNTEVTILQNTIELLLRGIVSDYEIEKMIENPYGAPWNKYEEKVRLRLWRSGPSFQDLTEDMLKATAELQEKLAINDRGKIRLTDRVSILAELKRATSFTLSKDEYMYILERLQNGNASLRTLAQQNSELETSRQPRAQAKTAHLIRRLSSGIFSAVHEALTCGCISSHAIGLAIPQRGPVMVPQDKEEDTARKLNFHVVLGTHSGDSQRWDTMRVRQAEKEAISHSPIPSPAAHKPPSKTPKWVSAILTSSKQKNLSLPAAAPTPSTNRVSTTGLPRSPITNLCQSLRKGKGITSSCYGFINGRSDEFDVYHSDCAPLCCGAITLRHILEGRGAHIPAFNYPERLRLALALSFGVFYLYNTPWLAKAITLDDIVFLSRGNNLGHDTCDMDQPILAKPVLGVSQQSLTTPLAAAPPQLTTQQQTIQTKSHRQVDPTILSHGLLLIQIITGNYSAQLRIEDGMTLDDILEKQTMASKMAGLVLQNGGMNYAGAVQWCLENFLAVANLDNAELARQFYNAVISKLETDMELQSTPTS